MKTKEELNALKRGNTKMEKITKEELKNLLGVDQLSDDDLEKISGGNQAHFDRCFAQRKSVGYTDEEAYDLCFCEFFA